MPRVDGRHFVSAAWLRSNRDLLQPQDFQRLVRQLQLWQGRLAIAPYLAGEDMTAAQVTAALARGRLVCLSAYDPPSDTVWLPRGLLADVAHLVPSLQVVDRRLALPPVDYRWRSEVDAHQYGAIAGLVNGGGGLLVAPTGGGKTRICLALLAVWRQPALWVTHRKDLLAQVRQEAAEDFTLPRQAIGFVGEGRRVRGSHITVAMVQALDRNPALVDSLLQHIGTVVVEEAHHQSSTQWLRVVSRFPALHRLGQTGTLERTDGLEPLARAVLGPVTATITEREAAASGRIVLPVVRMIESGYRHEGSAEWNFLNRSRAMDSHRNAVICSLVKRERDAGARVLVLVDRVEHARTLAALLVGSYGVAAVAVVGSVPREVRARHYGRCERQGLVLVATSVANEGLNLPSVDALVLGSPGRSAPRVRQQVGRVMRAVKGKTEARVWDVADMQVPSLADQARARWRLYRERGWRVLGA